MSNSPENAKASSNHSVPSSGQTLKLSPSSQADAKPVAAPSAPSVANSIPKAAPAPFAPAPTPVQSVASSIPQARTGQPISNKTTPPAASAMPAFGASSTANTAKSAASAASQPKTVPAQPKPAAQTPAKATSATSPNAKNVDFHSENIGQWTSRQENPFAEQNRKTAARKTKRKEKIRKARPYVFIIGIVAAILIATSVMIAMISTIISRPAPEIPPIAGATAEDVLNYKELLHKIYQENGDNTESVDQAVDKTLGTSDGREYEDEVRLAQMLFYQDNNQSDKVSEIAEMIDPEELNLRSQLQYYNSLYYAAQSAGDTKRANELLAIIYNVANAIGGDGA